MTEGSGVEVGCNVIVGLEVDLGVRLGLGTVVVEAAKVTVGRSAVALLGAVGARLAAALYNDGSGGLGTGADVPGPGSQVGVQLEP